MELFKIIQQEVDRVAKTVWANDNCPPTFIVSNYQVQNDKGNVTEHKIMLTIQHNGIAHSRVIFPKIQYSFGYGDIKDEMQCLYNSTM